MDKLTEEQKQMIEEFRKLPGYDVNALLRTNVEEFLIKWSDTLLQKEREAGKREGIEEGGYGGRMEAMNLLIDRYKDNGWLVNDLNDVKSGKVKKLARLSLWSEGNDRFKSQSVEKKYPCMDCGILRTKAEGGTTFTVCDDCWDKKHKKKSQSVEKSTIEEEGK